jgi:response regulator RpfG family c-di-GMP phosphodiesterase
MGVVKGLKALAEVPSDKRSPAVKRCIKNGVEFLLRVMERYPDTLRLMLSGDAAPSPVTDAIRGGAIHKYLTKPWNNAQLREIVREAFIFRSDIDSYLQQKCRQM